MKVLADSVLPLPSLSSLNLANNNLGRVEDQSFEALTRLQHLDLRSNSLIQVPSAALDPLHSSMETLLLGGNLFTVVERDALAGLEQLARLDVSGCPALQRVEAGALAGLPRLRQLSMANNSRLTELEAGAFGAQAGSALEVVDLSNNGLTDLSAGLLPWARLVSLQVAGNPLHCDCSTLFLQEVIYTTVNNTSSRGGGGGMRVVRCWTPPSLRDHDLARLRLHCDVMSSSRSAGGADILTLVAVAAVVAVFVTTSVLLVLVRLRRNRRRMATAAAATAGGIPALKDKDILRYDQQRPEPRYVVNTYRTMQGRTLLQPTMLTSSTANRFDYHQTNTLPFNSNNLQPVHTTTTGVSSSSGSSATGGSNSSSGGAATTSLFRNQDYFDSLAGVEGSPTTTTSTSSGRDHQARLLDTATLIYADPSHPSTARVIYMDPDDLGAEEDEIAAPPNQTQFLYRQMTPSQTRLQYAKQQQKNNKRPTVYTNPGESEYRFPF